MIYLANYPIHNRFPLNFQVLDVFSNFTRVCFIFVSKFLATYFMLVSSVMVLNAFAAETIMVENQVDRTEKLLTSGQCYAVIVMSGIRCHVMIVIPVFRLNLTNCLKCQSVNSGSVEGSTYTISTMLNVYKELKCCTLLQQANVFKII